MVEAAAPGAPNPQPQSRLWVGAAFALVGANVVNLAIRWVGIGAFAIPADFAPLAAPGPTIFFTTVGTLGATVVYALIRRFSTKPDRLFRRVALIVLVVSFVPDLWLLTEGAASAFPGATPPAVGLLMLMHVATAVIIVWALTMRRPVQPTA